MQKMNLVLKVLICLTFLSLTACGSGGADGSGAVNESVDLPASELLDEDAVSEANGGGALLDTGEVQHLVFMREEEKLARDVYLTLGAKYPNLNVFGNIAKSEERHTCAVCDKLEQYGIEDPVDADNIGVFSGVEYGAYFSEKFQLLVDRGEMSELEALYVGAYIEELDMIDIVQCPKAIIDADNGLDSPDDCGLEYTENDEIVNTLTSLLEGSKDHLRAFVKLIESRIGEGNYQAQILDSVQVDEILGR